MMKQDCAARLSEDTVIRSIIPDLTLEEPEMPEESTLSIKLLHPLEPLFEAAFNSSTDAMMIIDSTYRIVAFNKSLEKLTGWQNGQALGEHCYKVFGCGSRNTTKHKIGTCPLDGNKTQFGSGVRHAVINASRKRTRVSMKHAALPSSILESRYQLVVINKDGPRREPRKIDQDVIAGVSHELLSPLNLIRGYAATLSSLEDTLTSEQKRRYLRAIESTSFRLAQVVRNILDLPRIEAEGLNLSREVTSLPQLIRNIVTEIQQQSVENVIRLSASRALPQVNIDRKKIEQVLINLLVNAIKYSPRGSDIEVSIHGVFEQKDMKDTGGIRPQVKVPCLIVSVRDSGIGIAPEEIELIFEKYYRADTSLKHAAPGVGMGLYICKVIVEGHGGNVWAKSKAGKGSTFYFSLPVGQDNSETLMLKAGTSKD